MLLCTASTEATVADNAADLGDESFKFGKPISIADTLAGDTSVLLPMRNRVTYDTDVKDVFEHMQEIIK